MTRRIQQTEGCNRGAGPVPPAARVKSPSSPPCRITLCCVAGLKPISLNCSWKREVRVKKMENRMKGETWYYTPCGRRMKQFPEIIKVRFPGFKTKPQRMFKLLKFHCFGKWNRYLSVDPPSVFPPIVFQYLKRHTDSVVSREHFSFSPRMPVGDFYEERQNPEVCVLICIYVRKVPTAPPWLLTEAL